MMDQIIVVSIVCLSVFAMCVFGIGATAINIFDRDRDRGFPVTRRRMARRNRP